ncbi:hypothetical protein [Desulfococcus sp.]
MQQPYARILTVAGVMVLSVFFSGPVRGQEQERRNVGERATEPAALSARDGDTIETLKSLIQTRMEINTQIKDTKQARNVAGSEGEKTATSTALDQLRAKLSEVESDFESIATGVDIENFLVKSQEKIDWKEELSTLLTPLLSELKQLTDRPRQQEKLRSEIQLQQNQLATIKVALRNIDTLIQNTADDDIRLKKALEGLREEWLRRERQVADRLKVDQYQLQELLRQRQSIFDSSQEVVKSFFRSRGKNFIMAVVAFFATFFLMRYVHRLVYRFSPIHKRGERTFIIRMMDVFYHILTGIGATGALLFVLYTVGDWLLLSFAIIFIIGVAWTAKAGLPMFWRQVQLMLNLGTVRENERIIFNGIPWRVASLNVYATLDNPDLRPRLLRVPLRDILDLNSRTYDAEEPWFPCRIHEWVLLSDGNWGEIVSQTPEMVQLVSRGGSRITYPTQDFLGLGPKNISKGFRIKIVFGLDYNLQASITQAVPEKLEASLRAKLEETGYYGDLVQLKVEVAAAGPSSLDLAIIADFSGKMACYYNKLNRLINRMAIETCNENEWNIPFPQLTVHTQEPLRFQMDGSLS